MSKEVKAVTKIGKGFPSIPKAAYLEYEPMGHVKNMELYLFKNSKILTLLKIILL